MLRSSSSSFTPPTDAQYDDPEGGMVLAAYAVIAGVVGFACIAVAILRAVL